MSLHLARPGDRPAPSPRVPLSAGRRVDVEEARQFLMELDGRMAAADASRLAYLIGRLEGHAQTLMDLIDAITEVS